MKFKRGAFAGEKRVRPMLIKVDPEATMSIYYDPFAFIPLLMVTLCWFGFQTVEVGTMPDFEPNEYLFKTHKDKGEERWEIVAWAVRDAMSKAGGLATTDLPNRLKIKYIKHMMSRSKEDYREFYAQVMKDNQD